MQTLECVVVDDEPLALKLMADYVEKTPDLHLAGAFSNSTEALAFLRENPVQLAFFDIQMPGLNGLELSKLLADEPLRVVFVTAYEQYAVEGFKAEALDYLLKPASYDDFLRAVRRARRWFDSVAVGNAGKGQSAWASFEGRERLTEDQRFFVRADYRWVNVRTQDILFVESDKDYVKIHLDPNGQTRQDTPGSPFCIMTLQSLKALEERLSAKDFVRVHRSYIINLNRVSGIEKNRIVFADGQSVPLSDSYKTAIEERIAGKSL